MGTEGIGLVFGGRDRGLMGAVARGSLTSGGEVIGVVPPGIFDPSSTHKGLTQLIEVRDIQARKRTMYELADSFIVLPGGLGTLDELFKAATWNQLELHPQLKPIVLLDEGVFFRPLLAFLDQLAAQGLMPQQSREHIQHATDVDVALRMTAAASQHD